MGSPSRRRGRPPPHVRIAAADRLPPPRELLRGGPLPTPLQERRFMWGFPSLSDLETEDGDEPWPAPSHASSFAAPPSDFPGAERARSRTGVRQSVLYSDRPRRLQRRRPSQHPSEVSSTERQVTSLPTLEALSASGSAEFHPGHPEDEGPISGTRIRQSLLYSSRPRRPRRRQVPLLTEQHPSEVKTDLTDTDLAALEALALMNELPQLSPEKQKIVLNFDTDDEHHREAHSTHGHHSPLWTEPESDTEAPHEPYCLFADELRRIDPFGRIYVDYHPPGIPRSMLLKDDSPCYIMVSDWELPNTDSESDVSSYEFQCEIEESEPPCNTESGTEPTSGVIDRAAAEAQMKQETWSVQAPEKDFAEAIQSDGSSTEDIVRNGKKWMCEEVMLCFEKYIARRSRLVGVEYKLDELCYQCFNVVSYNNVFHHYNFRVMLKMPGSAEWTAEVYFAEVKQIFGRKFYFCCDLEPDEDGVCYACKNQGVVDLKHPATGGYKGGPPDAQCGLWFDF